MTDQIVTLLQTLPRAEPTPAQTARIWQNICTALGWHNGSWICDACDKFNYGGEVCGHCRRQRILRLTSGIEDGG